MTDQHRAMPEQWDYVDVWGVIHDCAPSSCILELRARVEALEAAQQIRVFSAEEVVPIVVPASVARSAGPPADDTRALLLWLLWHHQGARSDVGQPIRDLLGMSRYEPMSDEQLQIAREWGDRWLRGEEKALAQPHPAPASTNEARPAGLVERVAVLITSAATSRGAAENVLREVAEWLDTKGQHGCSLWLREEADRG